MITLFQLRPYQNKLVSDSRNILSKGKKGVFIQSPPGSGKSVVIAEIVRLAVNKNGRVLFIAHREELLDNIKETLLENEVDLSKVDILSPLRVVNRFAVLNKPSLIVTDEGHHGKAKTYLKIYEFYKDVPRLGFSATPWRMSGEGFTDLYEDMVEGPSIRWLIDNKCLAPYKWYGLPTIDRSKVDFKTLKSERASTEEQFSDAMIQGDIIKHYKQYADGRQAIVYAPTIKVSELIAEWFNDAGISAIHADGTTNKAKRKQIMKDFKADKFKILCNVDLISEGFNVPDVGVVILCRPTKSLVLHLQQSMRGMRYRPGKESIILDHVGNGLNLGLPTTKFEWSLSGSKKQDRTIGPPCMTCTSCGQVIEKEEIMNGICPRCGAVIIVEEKGPNVKDILDEDVLMTLLSEEEVNRSLMAKRKYKKRDSLSKNYEISKAKAAKDKKNALYKLFGAMVAYNGKKYTEAELQEFADNENISINSVNRAYNWASCTKEKNAKKEPFWKQSNFY